MTQNETASASSPEQSTVTDANSSVESSTTQQGANSKVQETVSEKPKSVMDAVNAALDADKGDGASPNPEGKTDTTEAATAQDGKDGKTASPDDTKANEAAEDAKLPFHNHPRWQEMVRNNRELKSKAEEADKLRPDATYGRQIIDYMERSQLTAQETAAGFEIMRAMKMDPVEAYNKLLPYVESLRKVIGEEIPEDLRKKVEQGYLDEESAQGLTRSKAQLALREAQIQAEQKRQAEVQQRQFQDSISGAVNAWETNLTSRDPEYLKIKAFVWDRAKTLAQANPPKSAEEATGLAQKAYDEVKAGLTAYAPKPTPKPIVPLNSQGSSVNVRQRPKSAAEAVDAALATR